MELISAMLLLGIIMTTVAFSSSAVISGVNNRLDASSNYVLAMNKAESVVYAQSSHFANSVTFSVTNNVINYTEAVPASNGFTLKSATIDFRKELNDAGVSNVTAAVTTSTTDHNVVAVNLSTVDKTGRRYENTVILRKLINAAPLLPSHLSCSFETPTTCSFKLLFPAVSFFPTTSTTPIITTTTGSAFSAGIFSTATYSLTGKQTTPTVCYDSLSIQTSTSASLIQIPRMKGLDSTVSDELWVKVD